MDFDHINNLLMWFSYFCWNCICYTENDGDAKLYVINRSSVMEHGILWPIVKYFKTKHQRGPLHSFHYADVTLEQILSDLFLQAMIDKIATCR